MEENKMKYDALELARIIGEPKDPKKPYPEIVNLLCETDTAEPNEFVYQFDVLAETDKVYVITSTGELTQESVTPDTPGLMTFIDVVSPEYFVRITDLASAKERTLARKVATINRALNAWESYKVLGAALTATQSGNTWDLTSGQNHFSYNDLVNMIDGILDYADNYVLVVGSVIDKDIKLWDWLDNKYTSLATALKDLNVNIVRQFGQVWVDGGFLQIFDPNTALLVGLNGISGKPILFVRKKLNDIELMGGAILKNGEKPERLVFTSPNPIHAVSGTTRYLAIGLTGYEEIALAVTNPYALAKFTRS